MDRYLNLTQAMPTSKTTSLRIVHVFFNFWIDPYGISIYLLTVLWSTIYRRSVCNFSCHNRRDTLDKKCIPPSNKWADRTLQLYNRHTACCRKSKRLRHIRAAFIKCKRRGGAQVHTSTLFGLVRSLRPSGATDTLRLSAKTTESSVDSASCWAWLEL